jgi:hypothetical protein
MHPCPDSSSHPLPYARIRFRPPWKAFLLGVVSFPAIYIAAYMVLRLCGVFYPFYNQGGWDIDGTTHVYLLDVVFMPANIIECDVQNRLHWLREPGGG